MEVPVEPGQDIDQADQTLGLLDGLTGNIALVPATVSAEEWEVHVAAEQAWEAQHHVESAETERPPNSHGKGG